MKHDAAQAGVGMNEAVVPKRHQQVVLRGAGTREYKVAAQVRTRCREEAGPRSESEVPADIGVAQRVSGRSFTGAASARDKTYAIDPGYRISPPKVERAADQRLGPAGKGFRCHRGSG